MIDVFYRIRSLYELGVKIHLHCFKYGRHEQTELNKYCIEVTYYKRNTGINGFSFRLPYIVKSRANKELLQNLLKDDHPVLLEGIHCTYFLFTGELNKKTFVRSQNVEFEYYRQLANNESSVFKRLYYKNESRLLKKYEEKIVHKAKFFGINKKDIETYQALFGAADVKYLPAFLPASYVSSKEGRGDYCLYHGNLSVIENENAVVWLCENIFNQLNIPFIIAGKNPSEKLKKIAGLNKNVSLISNPAEAEMNELISNAQVNILPSFNSTGIKLKLLNSLLMGRYCIVNKQAIDGTSLGSLCHTAESEEEFKAAIQQFFDKPFSQNEIEKRSKILKEEYDNKTNAELLMQMI